MKLIKMGRIAIISLLIVTHSSLMAAPLEYEIKAAFIYNFTKFVEWADQSGIDQLDTLSLCILGEDPFGETIDKLEGRTVQNLSIRIQRLESMNGQTNCQIMFISQSEIENLSPIFMALGKETGLLTISDIKGFADSGGIIELVLNDNKISFIINIEAARQANVYLSSKILRLANVVGGDWGN